MAFTKITPEELRDKGVIGLPDAPELNTTEMQEKFDEIALDVIVPHFNDLVDELDIEHGDVSEAIEAEEDRAKEAEETLDGKIDDEIERATLAEGELSDAISALDTSYMKKSVYDSDGDGVVDNSEALDGHSASYFATFSDLNGKVDKVDGKGLSTNDFTTTYKNQIDTNTSNIGNLSNLVTTAKNNLVAAINEAAQSGGGASDIDDLNDVTISNPADGQVLKYNSASSKWENGAGGGGGASTLSDLTDTAINMPTIGQVLAYSSINKWTNIDLPKVEIKLDDVLYATATRNATKIVLTWKDPADVVIGSTTVAEWEGTRVVRKANSAPQNENDGTIIVNSIVRDQYETNGYEDTNIDSGTTYYYRFFPYTTDNLFTQGSIVEAIETKIYGAVWDGSSSPAWSRTDDAASFTDPVPYYSGMTDTPSSPFDNILPWSGMTIVDDADVGKLVRIPKFYYKWTRNGSSMKLQISMTQEEGFLCSPAHADRGDSNGERDYVYVARYDCSSSDYKSTTGVSPKVSVTRGDFRTAIHNLGSNIWQYDYAMFWTIGMLYLVEFAHWDSQLKIGFGCGNGSSIENTGATDSMQYHTGTNATARNSYGHTQYRYIEDLWSNVFDWCDGIYLNGTTIYGINNPSNYSDTTGGTEIGTRPTSANSTKAWNPNPNVSGLEYAITPSETLMGNYDEYVCDRCNTASDGVELYVGGSYANSSGRSYGLFFMDLRKKVTASDTVVGSRLMKLP